MEPRLLVMLAVLTLLRPGMWMHALVAVHGIEPAGDAGFADSDDKCVQTCEYML